MKLSVLIPYRPDTEHRARVQAFTKGLWAQTPYEVVYEDDGAKPGEPFSYARAINRARAKATGDWFLSYSADALPPSKGLLGLLDHVIESRPWIAAFQGQVSFNHHQTERILRGDHPRDKLVGPPAGGIAYGREAIIAVQADVWDTLHGYDETFVGWGPEDKAWHYALRTIFSNGWDHPTDEFFRTLWHPQVSREHLSSGMDYFYQNYLKRDPVEFRRWYLGRRHNLSSST